MSTHATDPFHSLLFDPPGTYALTPFGQTTAVTLTGCSRFRAKGYNLFRMGADRLPPPPIHDGLNANSVYFCLPADRVSLSLALFFNAALVRANTRDVVDAEGDFVEVVCDREAALWEQAQQLACDFIVSHMRPDYSALPSYEGDDYAPPEHGLGQLGAAHESE